MTGTTEQMTDKNLVEAVLRGEKQMYEELINRYKNMAYKIALKLLGDIDLARDVVQESFIAGYKNLERLKNPSSFQSGTRKKPGGNKGLKIFLFLLAIIGAFALYQYIYNSSSTITTVNKAETAQLHSPFNTPGLSWRARFDRSGMKDGKWVEIENCVTRIDVLGTDPDKGSRLRFTIEKYDISKDQEDWALLKGMEGRSYEYYQNKDGVLEYIGNYTPDDLKEMETIAFIRIFTINQYPLMYRSEELIPGNSWSYYGGYSLPGYPESRMESQEKITYKGYKTYNGKEYAFTEAKYEGNLGCGFPIKILKDNPRLERTVILDNAEFYGTSEYYFNKETGRLEVYLDLGYDANEKFTINFKTSDGKT